MTSNPALFRLIDGFVAGKVDRRDIDESCPFIIPDNFLTQDEIESLREEHNYKFSLEGTYLVANFLPDDIRPEHVKKM